MKKLWKRFDKLQEKCMENMAGINKEYDCWAKTFAVIKEIVLRGRAVNKNFARELYLLDEETDYEHEVEGWLEDYFGELEMLGMFELIIESCDWLIANFDWEEDSPTQFYFSKYTAMSEMGKLKEAEDFCMGWLEREPENLYAASACVLAKMENEDFASAEQILDRFLGEDEVCDEETDILFVTAARFYEVVGNQEKLKRVQEILQEYEENYENPFAEEDDEELKELLGKEWSEVEFEKLLMKRLFDGEEFPFN